jgi:hypothetical protein
MSFGISGLLREKLHSGQGVKSKRGHGSYSEVGGNIDDLCCRVEYSDIVVV